MRKHSKNSLFFLLFLVFPLTILSNGGIDLFSYDNKYEVTLITPSFNKIVIQASYRGSETYYLKTHNPILLRIMAEIFLQSDSELRIRIKDATNDRFEIPESDPYPHDKEAFYFFDQTKALYQVLIENYPFSFKVIRPKTQEVIFSTQYFNFICSDRYFEISSTIPSGDIFGIGERVFKLKLQIPGVYTIWNRDLPATIEDAATGALNTYGLYPLYLARENHGYFHMVYLRNANGMDIFLNNTIVRERTGFFKNQKTITYKVTGGIIDFKFFIGGESKSPEDVVKMFHSYIGGYTLQPFWSFGFHQSRWGYLNLEMLNATLWNYHSSGMPLDAIWMDIDYMEDHRIFTIDEQRYDLTRLQFLLKEVYKKKLVLIIDPGVAVQKGYTPYETGINQDIFIKNYDDKPLLSCVWPGLTHFPDFTNNKTQDYWSDMFDLLSEKINFSGIWLDMNEISSFVDGAVGVGECGVLPSPKKIHSSPFESIGGAKKKKRISAYLNFLKDAIRPEKVEIPPPSEKCGYYPADYFLVYNPGESALDHKAICLSGKHSYGNIEYNIHNFNGFLETISTFNYLSQRRKEKQPFILSRSTVPGSGRFTTHWTGDNVSTFKWMKLSISGLINFNIFGIPNVGADICGFDSDTTEELCSRWMQLGALYPFSRNHNTFSAIDQDPFAFGPTLVETSMKSLKLRYSLLKYYYSLFVRNKGVGTVMRPIFFEFPDDPKNYNDDILDREFLIGNSLLVTPVLEQYVSNILPYFPGQSTLWYDLKTGKQFSGGKKNQVINKLNETVPLFLRSGSSIYVQNVENVNSTYDLDNNFYFAVGLEQTTDMSYVSVGDLMACDDYNSYDKLEKCINGDCMLKANFVVHQNQEGFILTINIQGNSQGVFDEVYLHGIFLYGFQETVASRQVIFQKKNKLNRIEFVKRGVFMIREEVLEMDFGIGVSLHPNDSITLKFN